jgi:L-lactate dehydrogenase complex protein LldE
MIKEKIKVGLFVTCLVDLFRPQVAFAAIQLLENAGCEVSVPEMQTCCSQPAFNSGDREDSKIIAKQVIDTFQSFDYVVAPSGSCTGMIKVHYPELFCDNPELKSKALALANKTHELIAFLVDVLQVNSVTAEFAEQVTYHDSCSSLRELKIKQQPRQLLQSVKGLTLNELKAAEVCCGFGGTFCVKYPDISNKIVSDKVNDIKSTGANTVLAADLGCLMNIAGKLQREGCNIKAYHIAEILANKGHTPGIGEAE